MTGCPLVVLYDQGSVAPIELVAGLAGLRPVVFLLAATPEAAAARPLLRRAGAVADLSGDPARDAAAFRALRPRGLVTFAESMLKSAAALAESAGLPGNSPHATALLTDKALQRDRLRAAGVDHVRSARFTGPEQGWAALARVGLPAVVKPVHGRSSRSTFRITDERAAARAFADLFGPGDADPEPGGWVAEEYLTGRESLPHGDYVSVETVSGSGGTRPVAVTGKHPLFPPFREVGQFWPSTLGAREQAEVIDLAVEAVRALGVTTGLCHTEIKLTPAGPRIIEVNGRLGGHINELARVSCGADLIRTAVLVALGESAPHGLLSPPLVHFQYNSLAPTVPCELLAVHGADAARCMPGITGYRAYERAGTRLPGGGMTRHLDLLWGTAEDHPGMVDTLERALAALSHEFRSADGSTWRTAPVLRPPRGLPAPAAPEPMP